MRRCIVGRIREALAEVDQRDLDLMLSRPEKYSTRIVAKALTDLGHEVRKDAVHNHQRAMCACHSTRS